MVDEIERLPEQAVPRHRGAEMAQLQKKVQAGLLAEKRLEDGSVAPWEISQLRKLATEGRNAQKTLRQRGHETSLPDEAATED